MGREEGYKGPILITGSSGFAGWNAVRYFVERGLFFVQPAFHTLPHYLHSHSTERLLQPVQVNIEDGLAVDEVVNRLQPAVILHFAAKTPLSSGQSTTDLQRVNVIGAANIARAAARVEARLIHISTDSVYPTTSEQIDESFPIELIDQTPYGQSKYLGENEVRASGADWTIIRPTVIFGLGTERTKSFTQFLDRSWGDSQNPTVFVDQFRSFVYIKDLLQGIEVVLNEPSSIHQIYNCAGEDYLSRAEFAERYARSRSIDPSRLRVIQTSELEGYSGGKGGVNLDTTKLRSLGWSPRSLTECFADMERERDNFSV